MARTKARQCTGKIYHKTKADAKFHSFRLRQQGAKRIHVYTCKHCGGFHVGHMSKPRRRR